MPRLSKIGAACLSAFGFGTGGAAAVTASYLVVAGAGGGGGGGGGAGGLLTGSTSLDLNTSYTIVIGSGGNGRINTTVATNGNNSTAFSLTAIGGGYGGYGGTGIGGVGGSGGGNTPGEPGTPAAGTAGQGYAGGTGVNSTPFPGGGGGGAGAVGGNGSGSTSGSGGIGVSSSITGTATYYAGGGGAQGYTSLNPGTGGNGGGGTGSPIGSSTANGNHGTANLGGGGGGGATNGGNGGSGVVIVRYLGAQQFGGGIVSSDGTYTIHTFNTSGQLVPMTPITASYLIVAGGGGGGNGYAGGGGAGGLLTGSGVTVDTSSTYLVTVGSGGIGGLGTANSGTSGTNSAFSVVTTVAVGGGFGGNNGTVVTGGNGGSGGGGGGGSNAGGTGTAGQGYAGGSSGGAPNYGGGGGGGAGAVGSNGTSTAGGNGGNGVASSISGFSVTYAGGGGGSTYAGGTAGLGGSGGGGNAGTAGATVSGVAGAVNLGAGGGAASGGGSSSVTGGNGGSGVVIISYAGTTQLMAGGTVTIVGGNVIHTFTSSGYLTPLTFIGRSLRFRSSASAYLSRTPSVASNRQTWTYSAWVKRGKLGAGQSLFSVAGSGYSTGYFTLSFNSSDYISVDITTNSSSTDRCVRYTNAVYRDPAAWYHVTFTYDVTQATDSNRLKLYVNGVQQTLGQAIVGTYPTQNTNGPVNSSVLSGIGYRPTDNDSYVDGYMAEVRFIDGQALTPNSFGTFNSYGVWQPINYGGSYGTNGFYLPFSDTTSTATLCYDKGPQGNHWTPNNISLTAGSTYDSMTDVPTLTSATAANYCVLNQLDKGATATVSNGNLRLNNAFTGSPYPSARCSIGVSSGKYYWEINCTTISGDSPSVGIATSQANLTTYLGADAYSWCYVLSSGTKGTNGNTGLSYGASVSSGDIVGVSLDMDAGTITFYKNNTSQGTAFTGLTGTIFPAGFAFNNSVLDFNFGQRPFAYTPPSGFVALNTYNL